MPSHDATAAAVEALLAEVARDDGLDADLLARLAADAAHALDYGRTLKPEIWAATVRYAFGRIRFDGPTQAEAAARFGVSAQSVTARFGQLADALDLLVFDPRYTAPDERPAVLGELDGRMEMLASQAASNGVFDLAMLGQLFGGAFGGGPTPSGPEGEAQTLVYDAWERLRAGDAPGAAQRFARALALDPGCADALDGLAMMEEDPAAAEALLRRAVAAARDRLGSDAHDAFHWWGELETRPYMRARLSLALALSDQNRHAEAAAELRALLALNPGDNQGVRYLLAPTHLLAGDLDAALAAYDAYDAEYPDDSGEPSHAVLRGLALWRAGRRADAVRAWTDALDANLYVVPAVLGVREPPDDLWFSSNDEWPDEADHHLERYEVLWDRAPGARSALRRFWRDAEVRARVAAAVRAGQEMQRLADARRAEGGVTDRWRALVAERFHRPGLSDEAVARLAGG